MPKQHLILVRHGESRYNTVNKFTGWIDVPLTEQGIQEAIEAADKLKNITIDIAFTSKLSRAWESLLIILSNQDETGIFLHEDETTAYKFATYKNSFEEHEIPIYTSDALNERYYGDLQGMDKDAARKKYGEEQVLAWRRGYSDRPPAGESLEDVNDRIIPYFQEVIMPTVVDGQDVIVAAHGNSLRAIIKYMHNISDEDISQLDLKTGEVYIYEFEDDHFEMKDGKIAFTRPIKWTPNGNGGELGSSK